MDPHIDWMDELGLFRIRCAKIITGDARDRKSGHFGISPGHPIEWSWWSKMPPVKDRADWARGLRQELAEALGRPASGAASRNKVRKDPPPPQAEQQANKKEKEIKDDKKAKKDKKAKMKEDHEKKTKKEVKRKKARKGKSSSSSSSRDEKPAKGKRKKKISSSSSDEKPAKRKKKRDRSSSSEEKTAKVKKRQEVAREEVPRALADAAHAENGGNGGSSVASSANAGQTPVAFRVSGFKTKFIDGLYRLREDRLTPGMPEPWGIPKYATFWKGEQMFFYWRPVPPKTRYVICQRYMASGADLFEQIQHARRSKELMNTPAIAFFSQRTHKWYENLDRADSAWSLASRVEYKELTSAELKRQDTEDLDKMFDDVEEEEEEVACVKPRQHPLRNPQTPGVPCPSTPNLTPLPQACPLTPTQALGQPSPSTPNLPPLGACPSTPTQAPGQPSPSTPNLPPLGACPSTPSQAPGQPSPCTTNFMLTPFQQAVTQTGACPLAPSSQAPRQPSPSLPKPTYPQAHAERYPLAQPSQAPGQATASMPINTPTLDLQAQSQSEAYPLSHGAQAGAQPSPYVLTTPSGAVQAVTGPTQVPCPQPGLTQTRRLPPPRHLRQGPDMC
ncbi:unnamed protein product [Symbiodinium sp. CCMP2456]|nr:unnamed protein product [Symbiodinium sp. CCMP2456]